MDTRRTARARSMLAVMTFALALTTTLAAACGGPSSTSPPASSSPAATVAAPSPTPTSPPHTGKGIIAFLKDNDLYTIRTDGSGRRLLARDALCAAWSPDGRQIAYGSRRGLFVLNLVDLARRRLVDGEIGAGGSGISWSPDGGRIAFTGPGGYFSILQVVNADGSGLKDVWRAIGRAPGYDFSPMWSPQGRIFYGQLQRDDSVEIRSVNPDGSGVETIRSNVARGGWGLSSFSLSPDGDWLLLWTHKSGRCVRIPADGDGVPVVVLKRSPWRGDYQAASSWSPDGSRIVFSGYGQSGPAALYVVRIDGSHLRRIPNTKDGVGPAWRP